MTINVDVQKLDPGKILEFFTLDSTSIGGGVVRFHPHNAGTLTWQAEDFAAYPVMGEGFEQTSGQQPNPKLRVANIDGSISLLCMLYEDLVGSVLTRQQTFVKYIDAVNFDDGNPTADPTQEFPPEIWIVERKAIETAEAVEFELSSALDFNDAKLPARQIIANQCPASWVYRGEYCGYEGDPVATALDVPTTDPDLDRCGKRLASCMMREWPDGVLNFGGFPAAGLVRV